MTFGKAAGLVLPGGGARGAYQVGVLKAIAAVLEPGPLPFRAIAGVSAGSINATFLAQHADSFADGVERLERLWAGLATEDVFTNDFNAFQGLLSRASRPGAFLDNSPLRNLIASHFTEDGVAQALEQDLIAGLAVTASNFTTGEATTFFQARKGTLPWGHPRRDVVPTVIRTEHLLGSAALPLLFPPQKIGADYFVDGSLRMTEPLSPVINMGADRILVIGVRNEQLAADRPAIVPGIAAIAGYTLDSLFSENLNNDLLRMEQINALLGQLPWWRRRRSKWRQIKVMTVRPSEDLRVIASRFTIQLPRSVRLFLKTLGGWGTDWRLPSFLLFESAYTTALIDLGYRDGLHLRPQIEAFYS
jgi:NTE family protein